MRKDLFFVFFWISLALLFNAAVYVYMGPEAALNFLAGYLIEKALSIDNLFMFIVIFKLFDTPKAYQHKVLYWGVVGAIAMRILFIMAGIALFQMFDWVSYIFGLFLLYAAFKLLTQTEKKFDPEANLLIRMFKKCIPITSGYVSDHYFAKIGGVWHATLLLIVLLCVETTDFVFALDSIPAIFAITRDPLIVISSNIFAILGLRSLYFLLENLLTYFSLLHYGLAAILAFVGGKMLLEPYYHIPVGLSLGVIFLILALTACASLRKGI